MSDEYDISTKKIVSFDAPFLKIQYEAVRKVNRSVLKFAEKEIGNLNNTITKVSSLIETNQETAANQLDVMAERMRKLKRKLDELLTEEQKLCNVLAKRCSTRLDALNSTTLKDACFHDYSRLRLQRAIVDHINNNGHRDLAKNIATAYGIEDLVDLDFYSNIDTISQLLRTGVAKEALVWCNENRLALREKKSTLELYIRLQEFIEMARRREHNKCLEYAEKHLSVYASDKATQQILMPVLTLLIFPPNFVCGKYANYYDPTRWETVADMFHKEALEQYFVQNNSLLEIAVKTGLSAFKTNTCGTGALDGKSVNCPVCCTPESRRLSSHLPLGHHSNSTFICPITGRVMTDTDHPMVTADGYVYSITGVNESVANSGGKLFICPITKKAYPLGTLRRMYLT